VEPYREPHPECAHDAGRIEEALPLAGISNTDDDLIADSEWVRERHRPFTEVATVAEAARLL
jgi:hypothetical protein